MISDVLAIGNKVDVLKWENETTKEGELLTLSSRIVDFVDEKTLKIVMPTEKGRIIPLQPGENYTVYFYSKYGTYMSKAAVRDRYNEEGSGVLVIELLSTLEKLQRRKFFRVECIIDVQTHVLSDEEIKEFEDIERDVTRAMKIDYMIDNMAMSSDDWEKGIIIDISGGGVRYNSNQQKKKGDVVLLSMNLGSNGSVSAHRILAKNIYSEPIPKKPGMFENRAQFIQISTPEREEIIHFVFEEDRKRRKRERGN